MSSVESEGQLELDLTDPRVVVPWGGQAPRDLTRVALSPIFKRECPRTSVVFSDPEQFEMWATVPIKKGPRLYEGAPSLREILERRS